jgi:hypothetical protein
MQLCRTRLLQLKNYAANHLECCLLAAPANMSTCIALPGVSHFGPNSALSAIARTI